jgi:hypothetical protein
MVAILNPDNTMNEMQNMANPPYDQIMEFIRKEASAFIGLKQLIEDIDSDEDFMNSLDAMVALSNCIRTKSLDTLFASYNIFQIKKKRTLTNLRTYIKR